jgi:hypothetical protein
MPISPGDNNLATRNEAAKLAAKDETCPTTDQKKARRVFPFCPWLPGRLG